VTVLLFRTWPWRQGRAGSLHNPTLAKTQLRQFS